jgi:hypothetical protein
VSGVALGAGLIFATGYAAAAGIAGVVLQYGVLGVLLMFCGLRFLDDSDYDRGGDPQASFSRDETLVPSDLTAKV